MSFPFYSTSPKAAEHPRLDFLDDRDVKPGKTYAFCDGSSKGWHAAVMVQPGVDWTRIRRFRDPDYANIGAELDGMLLALENAPPGIDLTLVFDYIGIGWWLAGVWRANHPAGQRRLRYAWDLIEARDLELTLIHHGGHQKDLSHFTFFNNEADFLCQPDVPLDYLRPLPWPPAKLPG